MEPKENTKRGLDLVRRLVEVKEQEQKSFQKAYQSDPTIQAIFDELKKRNAQRRITT
ncbi:hypothetical protein [Spirosoma foliorum]|uniref:Uncharacterized protein n=1 Tax=Spirosoma foliorum TaxID=2710596 RepID=A0A7G5GNT5_9BACT|nr:hypothetical protein [Spirosoma foliorum]QMW00527.1 hypothetical protein H3H32_21270 [Spirosoma foliorum]